MVKLSLSGASQFCPLPSVLVVGGALQVLQGLIAGGKTVNVPSLILTKLTRLTTSVSANDESLPVNI